MLQEFDIEIKDKKRDKNVVVDHFFRFTDLKAEEFPLDDSFPDDKKFALIGKEIPWYADFVNYLVAGVLPPDINYQHKKNFFSKLKHYYWDEPLLYKRGANGIFRRCIPKEEVESVMAHSHTFAYDGHASTDKTVSNILQVGLYWPTLFKYVNTFIKRCDQREANKNIPECIVCSKI